MSKAPTGEYPERPEGFAYVVKVLLTRRSSVSGQRTVGVFAKTESVDAYKSPQAKVNLAVDEIETARIGSECSSDGSARGANSDGF